MINKVRNFNQVYSTKNCVRNLILKSTLSPLKDPYITAYTGIGMHAHKNTNKCRNLNKSNSCSLTYFFVTYKLFTCLLITKTVLPSKPQFPHSASCQLLYLLFVT